jgi:hypothetical protein
MTTSSTRRRTSSIEPDQGAAHVDADISASLKIIFADIDKVPNRGPAPK